MGGRAKHKKKKTPREAREWIHFPEMKHRQFGPRCCEVCDRFDYNHNKQRATLARFKLSLKSINHFARAAFEYIVSDGVASRILNWIGGERQQICGNCVCTRKTSGITIIIPECVAYTNRFGASFGFRWIGWNWTKASHPGYHPTRDIAGKQGMTCAQWDYSLATERHNYFRRQSRGKAFENYTNESQTICGKQATKQIDVISGDWQLRWRSLDRRYVETEWITKRMNIINTILDTESNAKSTLIKKL